MPFLDSDREECCPVRANKMDAAADPRNPRREMPASEASLVLETDGRYGCGESSLFGWFFLLSMTNLLFKGLKAWNPFPVVTTAADRARAISFDAARECRTPASESDPR